MTQNNLTFESIISKGGLDHYQNPRYIINVPIEHLEKTESFEKSQVLVTVTYSAKSDGVMTFAVKISNNGKTADGIKKKLIAVPTGKIDSTVKKNLGKLVTVKIASL